MASVSPSDYSHCKGLPCALSGLKQNVVQLPIQLLTTTVAGYVGQEACLGYEMSLEFRFDIFFMRYRVSSSCNCSDSLTYLHNQYRSRSDC